MKFDINQQYFNASYALADELNQEHPNIAMVQIYTTLKNVISNDIRFRATGYIQATHNED